MPGDVAIRRGAQLPSGRLGLGAADQPLARQADDVASGVSRMIASRSAAMVMRKGENDASDGGKSDAMPTGELPGAPAACVIDSALPYARSGILRSSTGTVGEKFEVRVSWRSDPQTSRGNTSYCAAECGEYHQFIKGYMLSSPNSDGSGATDISGKVFGGKPLDKNVFLEDGLDSNPAARYGHRKEKQTMNEDYQPDRATGPRYIGRDFPSVMIGTFADIDVTFVGKLVDTCNNTETTSAPWRVQYRGIIRP